jgi:hypothetical protein
MPVTTQLRNVTVLAMLLFMGASPGFAQSTPEDIQALDKVYGTMEESINLASVPREMKQKIIAQITDIGIAHSAKLLEKNRLSPIDLYPSHSESEFWEEYRKKIETRVSGAVSGAASQTRGAPRAEAFFNILRKTVGPEIAETVLSEWMGFAKPGGLVRLSKADKAAMANAKAPLPPRLQKQIRVSTTSASLSLDPDKMELVEELGGPGAGNGIIDAGEWITIRFTIVNKGKLPYFSASAWIEKGHRCAWIPASHEIELPELDPNGESANTEVKLYLSSSCPNNSTIPIVFRVLDTHRNPSTAERLTASIRVTNIGSGKLESLLIDRDVPGFSEQSSSASIDAEARLEISAGFNTSQRASDAKMYFAPHPKQASLLSAANFRSKPMYPKWAKNSMGQYVKTNSFVASDDIDVEIIGKSIFKSTVQRIAEERKWSESRHALLWFATDTVVKYPSPDPPSEADKQVKTTVETTPPTPMSSGDVVKLVKGHIELIGHYVPPISGGVLAADGLELLFEEKEFRKAYEAAIAPQVTTKTKEPALRAPSISYVHRNYFSIPIEWQPEATVVYRPPPPPPGPTGPSTTGATGTASSSTGSCGRKPCIA